jgi:glycosyltransferase involved in cell wall biosynthesis
MPTLYQLWDCLLYLSGGEGFGLPSWEAGLAVDGVLQPENKTGYWRMIADVPQAIAAVRKLYFNRELGSQFGANGRSFVQEYTLEIQAERWHQIFQRLRSSGHGVPAGAGDFHTSIP